ncbi:MAG: TonB-dependent receptor [Aurantibacter sp.]
MKKIFSLLMAMFSISAFAQNSLSGNVSGAENNEPLIGVTVYFPVLDKGTVTNEDGSFQINGLPTGKFKIVASYIGYQTFSKNIEISNGLNDLDIILNPSPIEMEEVIVSTPFHKLQRENVMMVEHRPLTELRAKGAITLSDGISNIAGVSNVSTGVGIGKPVIRGLSSNRVLVYTQGIRLENQQFGDEHGLGVNDAGIESVEVIKGPASLLYGSDALGGVLYFNPEKFALAHDFAADLNFDYFSNTQGSRINAGVKSSSEKVKFLARIGAGSHLDYKTGDNERVTNSRFRDKDFKAGLGYQSENFKTELRYNYNDSDLGIAEEIADQTKSRTPTSPYQNIKSHILSFKNSLFLKNSSVDITVGYIVNQRKEFEFEDGETIAALDMDLTTLSYNAQYRLPQWGIWETIVGLQGMRQTNKNSGEEVLIPDAITSDIGVLATSHVHLNSDNDLQLGLRYDRRSISGEENGIIDEEGYIAALDRDFNSFNAAVGFKSNITKTFTGRINLATGFRAPNLAELTSNGVHEGTNRFEIGSADLKNETNLQADLSFEYKNEHIELFVNGFYNSVRDYIFLTPNGEFVGQDPVFLYDQQNARLYGGEIGLHLHPHPLDWLHLESSFESVTGKLDDDSFLPLIPANSWVNTFRVEFNESEGSIRNYYGFASFRLVFEQGNPSDFETTTNGYNLLSAGLGVNITILKKEVELRLSANNLLNEDYIAHLSRFKSDGIQNIGRNFNLGLRFIL